MSNELNLNELGLGDNSRAGVNDKPARRGAEGRGQGRESRKSLSEHDTARKPESEDGLLDLDLGTGGLELGLDVLGFVLGHAFLDGLRSAVDQVLGFLEAQAGDGADFLNDIDRGCALALEDDVERRLLFGRSGSGGATSGGDGDRSGGGNAPLGLEVLHEVSDVQNGLGAQPLDDLVFGDVAHGI